MGLVFGKVGLVVHVAFFWNESIDELFLGHGLTTLDLRAPWNSSYRVFVAAIYVKDKVYVKDVIERDFGGIEESRDKEKN